MAVAVAVASGSVGGGRGVLFLWSAESSFSLGGWGEGVIGGDFEGGLAVEGDFSTGYVLIRGCLSELGMSWGFPAREVVVCFFVGHGVGEPILPNGLVGGYSRLSRHVLSRGGFVGGVPAGGKGSAW